VNLRWPLISSLAALAAGILVAALVLAFCGKGGEEPEGASARTPTATRTVTGTPRTGSPVATGSPEGTPSALTPSPEMATPSGGELPSEETPEVPSPLPPAPSPPAPPPAEETAPPGEATLPSGGTPLPATSTRLPTTSTVVRRTSTPRPTSTPLPTATPTPVVLPDLVVRDLSVNNDRLVIEIGNVGKGDLLPGQVIEFQVRGGVVDMLTLTQPLVPGASVSTVLENQFIYRAELVQAVVDPNNLIPEAVADPNSLIPDEGEHNNGFSKELQPDVPLDFAVVELLAVGANQHLAVRISNTTPVPVIGADIRLTVFRDGATEPSAVARETRDLGPFETVQIDVTQQVAVSGHSFRVVMEIFNLPDADSSNNTLQATIP
jgi:hypothetical protein